MEIVTAKQESVPATCEPAWRAAMREAIRDPAELAERLELPNDVVRRARAAAVDFPLFVPRSYLRKMKIGDLNDPLLRQVLPLDEETNPQPGFGPDPLAESDATLTPGLLQKYEGRALLVATGVCAVHCRYCFRRHYPYHDGPGRAAKWATALDAIRSDVSLDEVLLSGGDPLTIDDADLARMASQIGAIPQIARLRIHTRLPVVIPERVDSRLLDWIEDCRLAVVVVLHANHANEIDADVADACDRLRRAGVMLLNQAVLLRGVNDTLEQQLELSRVLVNAGVTPYYLHQLDRVAGAAHFETEASLGVQLVRQLRDRLPGYAVPRFVRETPGDRGKRVLA